MTLVAIEQQCLSFISGFMFFFFRQIVVFHRDFYVSHTTHISLSIFSRMYQDTHTYMYIGKSRVLSAMTDILVTSSVIENR